MLEIIKTYKKKSQGKAYFLMEHVSVYFLSSFLQIDCRKINSIETIICNSFLHPKEPKHLSSP